MEAFRSKTLNELQVFFNSTSDANISLEKAEKPLSVGENSAFVVGTYKDETNALMGAFFLEFNVAAALAASHASLPKDEIKKTVKRLEFSQELWSSVSEVLGEGCDLFKSFYAD